MKKIILFLIILLPLIISAQTNDCITKCKCKDWKAEATGKISGGEADLETFFLNCLKKKTKEEVIKLLGQGKFDETNKVDFWQTSTHRIYIEFSKKGIAKGYSSSTY